MKKNFLLLFIGILLFLGITTVYYYNNSSKTTQDTNSKIETEKIITTVNQHIFGGDKADTHTVEEGLTALELLQQKEQVVTNGEGVNAFVTEINGRKADENKQEFWAFYVNDKQAEVGAGSYTLKDGDSILWKIETY